MPFCDECDKYWTPNSMAADGTCPTCGRHLPEVAGIDDAAGAGGADQGDDDGGDGDEYKAPWHFKLIVVLTVVYLGWRFLQLFGILAS